MFRRLIALFLCFNLIGQQAGFAQVVGQLDIASHFARMHESMAQECFRPVHLRYLEFDETTDRFKLLLDKGDSPLPRPPHQGEGIGQGDIPLPLWEGPGEGEIEEETAKLMRYFQIGLALPNSSFWVNLRPDAPETIIEDKLAQTDIGRIMLEADVQLKKDTAAFTSPDTPEGREYWDKLYQKAGELFGSEQVEIPTYTRPWIVPGEIILRETRDDGRGTQDEQRTSNNEQRSTNHSAYIYKATLKVMLEEDYIANVGAGSKPALQGRAGLEPAPTIAGQADPRYKALNEYSAELIRQLIIPKITKAVNSAKRYADLRQVYYSLILAQWFKDRNRSVVRPSTSLGTPFGRRPYSVVRPASVVPPPSSLERMDSGNLSGLTSTEAWSKSAYFTAYQKSFKEGEYQKNETIYTPYGAVVRRYVSGGLSLNGAMSAAVMSGGLLEGKTAGSPIKSQQVIEYNPNDPKGFLPSVNEVSSAITGQDKARQSYFDRLQELRNRISDFVIKSEPSDIIPGENVRIVSDIESYNNGKLRLKRSLLGKETGFVDVQGNRIFIAKGAREKDKVKTLAFSIYKLRKWRAYLLEQGIRIDNYHQWIKENKAEYERQEQLFNLEARQFSDRLMPKLELQFKDRGDILIAFEVLDNFNGDLKAAIRYDGIREIKQEIKNDNIKAFGEIIGKIADGLQKSETKVTGNRGFFSVLRQGTKAIVERIYRVNEKYPIAGAIATIGVVLIFWWLLPLAADALTDTNGQGAGDPARDAAALSLNDKPPISPPENLGPQSVQNLQPESSQTDIVKEDAVMPEEFLTQSDRDKLDRIPTKDLTAIFTLRQDSREASYADYIYDWYSKEHPDISQDEFKELLATSGHEFLWSVIEDFLNNDTVIKGKDYVRNTLTRAKSIIFSQEFQQEYNWLKENLNIENADMPAYEVYIILQFDEIEKQRCLSAVKSKEFIEEFYPLLRDKFGINPNNKLYRVINNFLSPDSQINLRSAPTQEAFSTLRKYFEPLGIKFDLSYLSCLNEVIPYSDRDKINMYVKSGQYQRLVEEKARLYSGISEYYGFRAESAWELASGILSNNNLADLNTGRAKDLWRFYREHYPGAINYHNFAEFNDISDGFYNAIFERLQDIPLGELERFLALFGRDLPGVDLRFISNIALFLKDEFIAEAGFKTFIDDVLLRYPAVKELLARNKSSLDIIELISFAYLDKETFWQTNDKLSREFGITDFPYTEFLEIETKHAIWDTLINKGFKRISLGQRDTKESLKYPFFPKGQLSAHLQAIQSERAQELYRSLMEEWELSAIDLNDFLRILNDKGNFEFYTNPENARKLREIKEKYSILYYDTQKELYVQANTFRESNSDKSLILAYDILIDPKNHAILTQYYLLPYMRQSAGGKPGIWVTDLDMVSSHAGLSSPDLFDQAASLLSRDFGLNTRQIGAKLKDLNHGQMAGFLRDISQAPLKQAFANLKKFYAGKKKIETAFGRTEEKEVDNFGLFSMASDVKDYPEAIEILGILEGWGFDVNNANTVEYIAKYFLSSRKITGNLLDNKFSLFHQRLSDQLYGGTLDLGRIPELSDLYDYIGEDSAKSEVLFSGRFSEVISFVRDKFHVAELHSSTLRIILQVAENFDRKAMEKLVNELEAKGERIVAADLTLLSAALENPDLKEKLSDRDSLLQEAAMIYQSAASPRQSLDQADFLENRLKMARGKDAQDIQDQINKVRQDYTERPDPESLSNIALFRLTSLWQSLQSPQFVSEIGQIIRRDIQDKKTEYGGVIVLDKGGRLNLKDVKSHSEFDGAYASNKYFYLQEYFTFHLHALEVDSRVYSGPSGWLGAKGDVGYVDGYDLYDVIFTSSGHPEDASGNKDSSKIMVNVDMYDVDKSDPDNPVLKIIDVMTIEVDYYQPKDDSINTPESGQGDKSSQEGNQSGSSALTLKAGQDAAAVGKQNLGGIDFTHLPAFISSITDLNKRLLPLPQGALLNYDIEREWKNIQVLILSLDAKVSAQMLADYLRAACSKGNIEEALPLVIGSIAAILRRQEETCSPTEPLLKDLLIVLESLSYPQQLSEFLTS